MATIKQIINYLNIFKKTYNKNKYSDQNALMQFSNLFFILMNWALTRSSQILRLTMSCKMAGLAAQNTLVQSTQLHIANTKHCTSIWCRKIVINKYISAKIIVIKLTKFFIMFKINVKNTIEFCPTSSKPFYMTCPFFANCCYGLDV